MSKNHRRIDQTLDQSLFKVKIPKTPKLKLIKELNYKCQAFLKDGKFDSKNMISAYQKNYLQKMQRSRSSRNESFSDTKDSNFPYTKSIIQQGQENKNDSQVQIQDQNGNKFKGFYQNGIRVSGKMEYSQAQCFYQGSFFGDKFHGHGKLTYSNGRIIQGQWDSHALFGNATIIYPNDDVYYGEVNQKLYKNGNGNLFFKNGDKYVGQFKNGSISGYGTYYQNQKVIGKGMWVKGKMIKQMKTGEIYEQNDSTCSIKVQSNNSMQINKGINKKSSGPQSIIELMNIPFDSNLRLMTQQSVRKKQQRQQKRRDNGFINFLKIRKLDENYKG